MFAAKAAVTVFTAAYDDWADDATADFSTLVQRALGDLRHAVGSVRADGRWARAAAPGAGGGHGECGTREADVSDVLLIDHTPGSQ